jgi:hypothetical protein
MRDVVDHLIGRKRERSAPRPDRSEIADIWLQSGLPEGFSMEWVFDRDDQSGAEIRERT